MTIDDQFDRELIAKDLGRNLFVEAGAGTGKTTALVERLSQLAQTVGTAGMHSIAAITFTEFSAAELRQRVTKKLSETDPELARHVDDMSVGTIHSFARLVLTENAMAAQLPPSFSVVDQAQAALDFVDAWRSFRDGWLADEANQAPLDVLFTLGVTDKHLLELAQDLDGRRHQFVEVEPIDTAPVSLDPLRQLHQSLVELTGWIDRCSNPEDRLVRYLTGLLPVADDLGVLLGELDAESDQRVVLSRVVTWLADQWMIGDRNPFNTGRTVGQAPKWNGVIADVRAQCVVVRDDYRRLLDAYCQPALEWAVQHLINFVLANARSRRDEGRCTFDDLLVLTRQLLDEPTVLDNLRKRFTFILIDEFQDTDPLQTEIATLLAGTAPAATDTRHPGVPLGPGRLFLVGDPKQSIYRFRGADIATFMGSARVMDETVHLRRNFRSVPGIIEFANGIFAELFGQDTPGQARHLDLLAAREPLEEGPAVITFGEPSELTAAERREAASEELANAIVTAAQEQWPVRSPSGVGPAAYADMAVLFPTRLSLPTIELAFERAGIPYRLESAALLWNCAEARELFITLRAVANPADSIAVVGALRSSLYGCGDDDIALYRTHTHPDSKYGRSLDPLRIEGTGPVAEALASLGRLHAQNRNLEVSAVVDELLTSRRALEVACSRRRPRDHFARWRWLSDQSRVFDEQIGGTLNEFLTWAQSRADDPRSAVNVGPPDIDDDAVRVMTIHAAKGLEFPITFVYGLDQERNLAGRILFDDDGGSHFKLGTDRLPFSSPRYEDNANVEKELQQLEQDRLAYVAITRARDHLVVSLHQATKGASPARRLSQAIAHQPELALARRFVEPPLLQAGAGVVAPTTSYRQDLDAMAANRLVLAERRRAPVRSATEIGQQMDGPLIDTHDRAFAAASGFDADVAARIGRAVHATLAVIDLSSGQARIAGDSPDEVAKRYARAQRLDRAADADRVVTMVRRALNSDLSEKIGTSRYFQELFVAAPMGSGTVLEGFVDLVIDAPDGLVVIDFKTNANPDGEALLATYRLQLAAYAEALGALSSKPVVSAQLLLLGGHESQFVEINDLDAARSEVIASLAAAAPR